MTKIQMADRRKTGDKEIRKTKIEGISNSSSNVRKVMQINTQRSVLWGSGNQQLMKLTIRKQAKQIKVRLASVEINMKMIKTLDLEKLLLNMHMLINYSHRLHSADLLVKFSKANKMLKAWEHSICKTKVNKKSHLLSHGQVQAKVEGKYKVENKDGIMELSNNHNNTKEKVNIKTNGNNQIKNKKIQDTKEKFRIVL